MASDPKLKAEKGPDGLAITLSLDLCVVLQWFLIFFFSNMLD